MCRSIKSRPSIISLFIMNVHDSNVVDVGTPPPRPIKQWETKVVRFHEFEDLPRGELFSSPEFTCCGYQWRLSIIIGTSLLAVFLHNMTNEDVTVEWALSIRNSIGKEVAYYVETDEVKRHFDAIEQPGAPLQDAAGWGTSSGFSHVSITGALEEGTLPIEVRMKRIKKASYDPIPIQFIPKNPITNNILKSFNDEESADVVFKVRIGSEEGEKSRKKSLKTTTTNFFAHRLLLRVGAPLLAELCKPSEGGGEETTSVSITDVKPDIFRHMLYYLYGGKLTDEELKANARDIIDAADKYGVVHLKLEAEVYYVKSTTITLENMMDNLLYADSKNLALLKEAVMDYIVANKNDIIGKVSFDKVPSSMISDILAAMARGEQNDDDNNECNINYNKMRVGTLRKMLDDKGLDVDGSREAMISALKESEENA